MLCERCKKNTANTHLKSIVNGKLSEYNLCSSCAAELGYGSLLPNFSFNDILGGFIGSENNPSYEKKCPVCGSTFDDISKHGQVGCMNCYEVFFDRLLPMIQRIHGTSIHKGKIPGKKTLAVVPQSETKLTQPELSAVEQKKLLLKNAIEEQRFEDAAKLRDEIKELEKDE